MVFNCSGNPVALSAVGFADTYAWSYLSDPNTVLSNLQNYSVIVDTTTRYLLTAGLVYSGKTCFIRDTVTATPISAEFTYVQDTGQGTYGPIFGSTVHFVPDYPGGNSYHWDFGNNYVSTGGTSTEASPTYNYYPYTGYFTVTVTMTSFCGTTTSSKVVRVNNAVPTNVDDIGIGETKLYPNPAIDFINVEFESFDQISSLQVIDVMGRVLSVNSESTGNGVRLNISNLRSGVYIITIVSKTNKSISKKFMKQ